MIHGELLVSDANFAGGLLVERIQLCIFGGGQICRFWLPFGSQLIVVELNLLQVEVVLYIAVDLNVLVSLVQCEVRSPK